jgi:hypothetical protein
MPTKLTPRRVTALNGRIEGGHAGHVAGDDAPSRPPRAHEHERVLVPGVLVHPPGRRSRQSPALHVRGGERSEEFVRRDRHAQRRQEGRRDGAVFLRPGVVDPRGSGGGGVVVVFRIIFLRDVPSVALPYVVVPPLGLITR